MKATLLGLTAAALALSAAGATGDYNSQYMQRRIGRLPPAEQKIADAQRAATAFRAEPATPMEVYRLGYHYRRYGRYTPAQQALVDAYRASSAYRADPVEPHVENSGTYNQRYVYRKFGRQP